ncbi:MAG: hypothetical protein ACI4XW_07250 [Candidatus Spyradocola sp.]
MKTSASNKPLIPGKHLWKKALLCAAAALLLYVELNLLTLLHMDWARSRAQDWPRYLESLNLFWIEACIATAWTQLLAVCVHGCIRQFRKNPLARTPLPPKTWLCLFFAAALILLVLIAAACHFAPLLTAANAAQQDSAAGYARSFYPIVIAAELALGFLIWLLWDLGQRQRAERNI